MMSSTTNQVNNIFTIAKADTNFQLSYILVNGDPWFKGKEVADILGYVNTKGAISDNVDDEDKQALSKIATSLKGSCELPLPANSKNTVFINESGLYSLILRSQKEQAKPFQKWVTSEVLPNIRKTGSYVVPPPPPTPRHSALTELQVVDLSKIRQDKQIVLTDENQLHYKAVDYFKQYHPHAKIMAGLGELQETSHQRIEGKLKGYEKGCCDLMIVNKHIVHQGMCIELKTPKGTGRVKEHQQEWLKDMHLNGHMVLLSNDYDEVVDAIRKYFEGVRFVCPYCPAKPQFFKTKQSMDNHITSFRWNKKQITHA